MYDIIGDTHGHATRLEALLTKLGYREQHGAWRHPERKVVFLGDFIDRGSEQLRTVQIAKSMAEAGMALSVLGNHEFNAVAYATPDPDNAGSWLRAHSDKNRRQHLHFLQQAGEGSVQHAELVAWFKTLPLYLDLDGLRAVHACWHPACVRAAQPWLTPAGSIRDDAWVTATRRGSVLFEAVETLLKGVEVDLPPGMSFQDKDGVMRHAMRARWWDKEAATYEQLGLMTEDTRHCLPAVPVDTSVLPGYDNEKPVFFGHYWLSGEPQPITPSVACLDYSVVRPAPDGKLCAYRWSGEKFLKQAHFEWV